MADLTVSKETVLEKYKKADKKGKALLETMFPKETFIGNVMDRIRSFEEAYPFFNKMKFTDELYLSLQRRNLSDLTSADMRMIIAEVLRDGWEADWDNKEEKKWSPIFEKQKAGFGFSHSGYGTWNTDTNVGSRLCFPNKETSDYFGTQFIDLHNKYLLTNYKTTKK